MMIVKKGEENFFTEKGADMHVHVSAALCIHVYVHVQSCMLMEYICVLMGGVRI